MIVFITSVLTLLCSVLLMFVILLQRGRGGGLAGAFGGLGGQSAFGTKAGDVFTRITIVLAVVWVVLNAATIYAMRFGAEGRFVGAKAPEQEQVAPAATDAAKDKTGDGKGTFDDLELKPSQPSEEKKETGAEKKSSEESATPPAENSAPEAKSDATSPAAEPEKKPETPAPEVKKEPAEVPKEPGK